MLNSFIITYPLFRVAHWLKGSFSQLIKLFISRVTLITCPVIGARLINSDISLATCPVIGARLINSDISLACDDKSNINRFHCQYTFNHPWV